MNSPKTTPGFGCALVGIPFLPLKPRPNGNATELSTDPATFESGNRAGRWPMRRDPRSATVVA